MKGIGFFLTATMMSLVFLAAMASAAEQTGNIQGTAVFEDGSAAPGVEVTARSVDGGPAYTMVTNAKGGFRFLALPPGEYECSFDLKGYNKIIQKGIVVRVGRRTPVHAALGHESIREETVTAGGVRAGYHTENEKLPIGRSVQDLVQLTPGSLTPGGGTQISRKDIETIPSRNRYYTDYLNLVPGMTPEIKSHGSTAMDNRYNLDGMDITDPVSGTSPIGLNMDIIEEIQVQSGGLSAEHGSMRGAVINVVTKSGGNKLSGTASMYMNHHSLRSDNTGGLFKEKVETGQRFQFEPGITLGGPIIKDKLWFFGSLGMKYGQTYAPGFPYDKKEQINPSSTKIFPYIKFTYAPNQAQLFNLSYNYSDMRYNYHDAYSNYSESVSRRYSEPAHFLHGNWLYRISDRFYTHVDIGYLNHTAGLYARQDGPTYVDLKTNRYSGGYYINQDKTKKNRFTLDFDGNYFLDGFGGADHELKFGASYRTADLQTMVHTREDGTSYIEKYPTPSGSYEYKYGKNFNGGYEQSTDFRRISAYIQDTIAFGKLTANIGIRFDKEQTNFPAQNQSEQPLKNPFGNPIDRRIPKDETPFKWSSISPRLGLTYALNDRGKTLVCASYSRYADQLGKSVWPESVHPIQPFVYGVKLDPKTGAAIPGSEYSVLTPNPVSVGYPGYSLKVPVLNELIFGVKRDVSKDWSVGLRYIHKWDRNLIEDVDASRLNVDKLMKNGTFEWIDYQAVTTTDPYSKKPVTFYNDLNPNRTPKEYLVNPPGAERNYNGLELTFNKRFSNRWLLLGSFTWSNLKGLISTSYDAQGNGYSCLFNNPNSHVNADGHLENERRFQFKTFGQYQTPWWGINLGAFFQFTSGQRWTRQVSSSYLKDVVLKQGFTTINAEERGRYAYPAQALLDLRIEKQFKSTKFMPTVYLDVFNLFNSGAATYYNTDSSKPYMKYKEELGWIEPRIFRLGSKIEF